jgi:hypothetical protein
MAPTKTFQRRGSSRRRRGTGGEGEEAAGGGEGTGGEREELRVFKMKTTAHRKKPKGICLTH